MRSKVFTSILCAISLFGVSACKTTVEMTEGPVNPETGKAEYSIIINNPPKGTDWNIWFSAFKIRPEFLEGNTATFNHYSGSLHYITPLAEAESKQLVIRYEAAPLRRQSWAPERFTLDVPGKKPVELAASYSFPPAKEGKSFDFEAVETTAYDMVPALKSCVPGEGVTVLEEGLSYEQIQQKWPAEAVEGKVPGWYGISIDGDVKVQAADEEGAFYAAVTLANVIRNAKGQVPNAVVEDWPDLYHRGLMLDVARNFTTKDNVLKLIDLLAHFKVNVLHLHLAEDEAWRIEIPGIPELTEFAAFHELPTRQEDGSFKEVNHIQPSYSGDFDPEAEGSGNGYYTGEDYVEIVRYAHQNHIRVIPEVDTPGHFRAALRGMDHYCDKTGDESYRLTETEDTSEYYSVQYYDDNAMNVALPGTYKFMEKLIDTFIAYHNEAGVPLTEFHIGGDEVPGGAWTGSPACRRIMEENGLTEVGQLKAYYLNKVMDIAEARGIKLAAWQEMPLRLDPATHERIKKNLAFTNVWSTDARSHKDELEYQYANEGINVIMCNMTNAYADFAYDRGSLERGHDWGGIIDERRSFSLLPFSVYKSVRWDDDNNIADIAHASDGKTVLEAPEHILGVQAQLWTETIRSFDHVTYFIFPKMLGLWERGWNSHPVWEETAVSDDPAFTADFNRFYSTVVNNEMPWFDSQGICYHKR